jgi:hypothetical protein
MMVVAEGSLIRETPGRMGAALTKPERVSTVEWPGFGERDGEVYARNPCCKAPQEMHWLKFDGYGPGCGAGLPLIAGGSLPIHIPGLIGRSR